MITDYLRAVQYHETDKMGVTHHSNYIKWMEEARIDFLNQIGFGYAKLERDGIISPVIGVDCKYLRSTAFGDTQADAEKVQPGMAVTIGDREGKVASISAEPVQVDDTFTDYMRHVGGLQSGEWVYAATVELDCPGGVHEAAIVVDSVSPMSFVLN